MATIILDQGEVFSHTTDDSNQSCCIKGKVAFSYPGLNKIMEPGDSICVPAGVKHVLKNLGKGKAHIRCAHSPPNLESQS